MNKKDRIFECPLSDNYIEFITDLEKKEVIMEFTKIDQVNFKLFLLLLKKALITFENEHFTTFVQTVTFNDWKSFLKSNKKWKLRDQSKILNTCTIECDIKDALINIAIGFGFPQEDIIEKFDN